MDQIVEQIVEVAIATSRQDGSVKALQFTFLSGNEALVNFKAHGRGSRGMNVSAVLEWKAPPTDEENCEALAALDDFMGMPPELSVPTRSHDEAAQIANEYFRKGKPS